jgi:hypothetical protein
VLRSLVVIALVASAARPAAAESCDPAEAAELHAHLTAQEAKASRWNWAWRITFTTAAVGTLAVAIADPFPKLRDGLYVSSGKAAIGALARWILPLRVEVPALTGDACADAAALRKAVTRTGRKERSLFVLGHVGGLLVNLGGAGIIWYRSSLGQGLLSIAIGYPIGLLSNYTMPRGSWHLWRERETTWTVAAVPHDDGWVVSVAGSF